MTYYIGGNKLQKKKFEIKVKKKINKLEKKNY